MSGKLSKDKMRNMINKRYGREVAFNLNEENPTDVSGWIPTGSRWLDSIIAKGMKAGIPLGKISSFAGEQGTGKSYMAAQIAANAQKMGMDVVYFDSESALDSKFLENAGVNVDELIYVQGKTVEFILETIEELLGANDNQMLFVWDSLAMTPCAAEMEADFNPRGDIALKARILSKGMERLTDPVADNQSVLLILNQLKTYIPKNHIDAMMNDQFTTPGGKSVKYAYSLEIYLTKRNAKSAYVYNDKGFEIGSEIKAKIKKSRFGTERRECVFDIMWGDDVGIMDEESWLEAIKTSDKYSQGGGWYKIKMPDGEWTKNYRQDDLIHALKNDPEMRKVVGDIMDEEIIQKFDKKEGNASDFYNLDSKDEEE